jgi:predicted dehydrogenase
LSIKDLLNLSNQSDRSGIMAKMKFGLIGCGRISYKHIEALINNSDIADLVAVCDIIEEKAEIRADQYKEKGLEKPTVYTDYKAMLNNEDIDSVIIATESGNHFEHAKFSLENNKHVLIEKPMAMSTNQAKELIDISKNFDKKIGVCHQNRFNPAIKKLREAIENNRFGKISNMTARILWNRNDDYYKQAPWRGTKDYDGGTLMNQCIHNIDLLQWMSNSKPKRIFAERDTFLRHIEMEDFGAALLRFENGIIGIIEGSAIVYPKNLEETLSVFGEFGTVVIGGMAVNEIKVWEFPNENINDLKLEKNDIDSVYGHGHTPLYKDFINSINNGKEPAINGEEAIKAVGIIEEIYRFTNKSEVK